MTQRQHDSDADQCVPTLILHYLFDMTTKIETTKVAEQPFHSELADSPMAREFGRAKRDSLPQYCSKCEVRCAHKNRFSI